MPVPQLTRSESRIFTLFAAGVLISLVWLVHPWYEPVRDAAIYIRTAQALLDGEGYSYLGIPFLTRPPGFSVLLTPIVGTLGTHSLALNLFVSLLGAAGMVLFLAHYRHRLGLALALATAALVWLGPGYRWLCNQVMSDVPGVTAVLACLLVERWASRTPSWRRELVLGLSIAAGAYVRSVCLLMVPAIVLARLAERLFGAERHTTRWTAFTSQRLVLLIVVVASTMVPWSLRNDRVALDEPVDQVGVYSYSVGMWQAAEDDPNSPRLALSDIAARFPIRLRQVTDVFGSRMGLRIRGRVPPKDPLRLSHAVIAAILVAGLLYCLVKHRAAAELLALGALAVFLFYFAFISRLVLPVYVLALPAAVEMIRDLLAKWMNPRHCVVVVAGGLLAVIVVDFDPRPNWKEIERRHQAMTRQAAALRDVLEPDARLASAMGFFYSVYLERPVYSLWITIRRTGNVELAEDVIDKYGIDSLILSPEDPFERKLLDYVESRYPDVTPAGTAYVVRVRPRGVRPADATVPKREASPSGAG